MEVRVFSPALLFLSFGLLLSDCLLPIARIRATACARVLKATSPRHECQGFVNDPERP